MSEAAALTPGTWKIDPAHSTVAFAVRHLMISKVRGRFPAVDGAIEVADDPTRSTVEVTVDMASISTGDETRDAHLRSADFFDVEQYPTMTFRSTGLSGTADGFVLDGELTIRDVTRPVRLQGVLDGIADDPWGATRAAFSASGELARKEWGLEWNVALEKGGVLVSDKVTIDLEAQAVQA